MMSDRYRLDRQSFLALCTLNIKELEEFNFDEHRGLEQVTSDDESTLMAYGQFRMFSDLVKGVEDGTISDEGRFSSLALQQHVFKSVLTQHQTKHGNAFKTELGWEQVKSMGKDKKLDYAMFQAGLDLMYWLTD
jgi:hypothetical protein